MRLVAIFIVALLISWTIPSISAAQNNPDDAEESLCCIKIDPCLMVVNFWTGNCKDSSTMNNLIRKLEPEYSEFITFLYIDIRQEQSEVLNGDNPQSVMSCFGLYLVPAQVFIKNSEIIDTHEGVMEEKNLRSMLDKLLK